MSQDESEGPIAPVPVEPAPVPSAGPVQREPIRLVGYGRAPALSLFAGGFLTCLGLVLSLLAMNGTIHPATPETAAGPAATTPAASHAPSSSSSPSSGPGASAVAAATMVPIVAPTVLTPTNLASGYSLGEANARVTVEAWEDFQCPYCRRFTEQVEPQLVATYVETGKVRLMFRDYAFLGDESAWAAVAADLAAQQGRFWPYHDYLFANQLGENAGSFTVARLEAIATAVGLDRTTFDAGLNQAAATATYAKIRQGTEAEVSRLAISGTPTIVVNGKALTGNDWATVREAIEAALAAKPSPARTP